MPLSSAQGSKWLLLETIVQNLETSATLTSNRESMFSDYCAYSPLSVYCLSFSDQQVNSPYNVLRK